ncbi:MAG: hypothetical protein HKO53_04185 [Gemmatimonadetes bacterium]|nr:hypothetical protein [Gemmatimonadota bacterium]
MAPWRVRVRLVVIGGLLAVPSFGLAFGIWRYARDEDRFGGRILSLNLALAGALLLVGIHNLPLALPAAFNVAYLKLGSRPVLGRILVSTLALLMVALFAGATQFMLSGQSFEQFQALDDG